MDEPEELPTAPPVPRPPVMPPPPVTQAPPQPANAGQTSPWVWVALLTSVVALLTTLALAAAVLVLGLTEFDDLGDDGPNYYVDQPSVLDAVEGPCEAMLTAAGKITLGGPPDEAVSSLKQWTKSARNIVAAIDGAHPNADSKAWRDDWTTVASTVGRYADNYGKSGNKLHLPDTLEDMYWETDTECGVPVVIAGLDPDHASYMYGE